MRWDRQFVTWPQHKAASGEICPLFSKPVPATKAEARDAKCCPQMLMLEGSVYEDRSQPKVVLFTAFKVPAEPAMTHLLLSNNKTNCDLVFFLAYESSSRAELH